MLKIYIYWHKCSCHGRDILTYIRQKCEDRAIRILDPEFATKEALGHWQTSHTHTHYQNLEISNENVDCDIDDDPNQFHLSSGTGAAQAWEVGAVRGV